MRKSKKKIISRLLIIIPSALLLAVGTAILGYYTFFPAKIKLMIAGYNSTTKLFNCIDKNMDLLKDRYFSLLLEDTIKKETKVGISANEKLLSIFLTPEEASDSLQHINRLALKCENQFDVKNRKQSLKLGLSYLLNPILTARTSLDGERFSFGVDELSNKTITGNISDLGKLSYFFPDVPRDYWDMIENTDPWIGAKIIEGVEIDRKAIKKIMLDHSREIFASIDSKSMSMKKQKTEVLGKELICQEIAIKLDEPTQKELVSKIIRKLSEDEHIYSLTAGNLIKALEIISDNGYYRELIASYGLIDMLSRDDFKKNLSQIEEEILNASLPEINLKVYVHGIDIVKYSLTPETGVSPGTEAETQFTSFICEQRINGPSFELGIITDSQQNNDKTSLHIRRDFNQAKDLSNIELKLDIDKTLFISPAYCSISIKSVDELKDKNEVDLDFEASIEYDMPDVIGKGRLNISFDGTKTKNSKKQVTRRDYKGTFTFDIPFISPDMHSMGFYYDTGAIFGEEITIPVPDDVLDLKTATETDFNQLIEEIGEKIEALGRLTGAF